MVPIVDLARAKCLDMISFLTLLLCFTLIQCFEISDVLENLVTEVQNEEFSKVLCKASSTYTKHGMPHYLTCGFQYMGEEVRLHLNRNNPDRYRLPVYSITKDKLEEEIRNNLETKNSSVDFYQNQEGTATFKVAKIRNKSGERFTLTGYIFRNMSHLILHPVHGSEDHRIFIPRNRHHITDAKYDVKGRKSGLRSELYKRIPVSSSPRARQQIAEILVVVDYKFYSGLVANETEFTHGTTSGVSSFLSEYIALLFDTTNIPYRNLVNDGIHLILKPVGIVVAKSKTASPWTEENKLNSTEFPNIVNASKALDRFHDYVRGQTALPPHDHALLLTGYQMKDSTIKKNNNTDVLGIASLSAMCGRSSQSVVSSEFDFTPAFTIAHELGHSFGSEHDGENNTCPEDGHVMNATAARNTSHIWQFSSCSVSYMKALLNKLDRTHKNCLLTQENHAVDHQLTVHEHDWYGQIYSADQQCQMYLGPESYMIRDKFNFTGAYQTAFCLQMVCYDPVNHEKFNKYATPGDGTTCGYKKWCMAGACVHQPKLTHSIDTCPQGEVPDKWLRSYYYEDSPTLHSFNFTASCKAYVQQRPEQCFLPEIKYSCCQSCSKIPQYTNGTLPESVYNSVLPEDSQCKQTFGSSSYFCGRWLYDEGEPDNFCSALRCYLPSDDLCHHIVAQDGTRCSYNKWCVAGQCVDDPRALLPTDYRNVPSPQEQCQVSYGASADFCGTTSTYSTNYHEICKKLYCILPEQKLCHSIMALDGTPCGTKMICQQGECVHSENGLDLREDCLYVDKSTWCTTNILGPDTAFKCAFGHNADVCCFTCQKYANMSMPADCRYGDELSYTRYQLTCAQLVAPSPQQCYESSVKQRCCQSCYKAASSLPGKSTPPSLDNQCRVLFGSSSYFCKRVDDYSTSFEPLCNTMYCADANGKTCHGIIAADRTTCGPKKWCLNGTCVHDDNAPNIPNSCVAGDLQDWCSVKKTDGSYKNSYVCYTNQKDECCDMCNRVHSPNTKGCEYGDHSSTCDRSKCSTYTAHSRNVLCCRTCA
uniref:A disintegrin and metalloproteinase with thrombospondin motifs gon-1-like n=1 Tax=Crassostrea virginica TaxID=6565 RepID=A0A8B8AFP4_CRAVI|nr:A disintegrin and metalloproteinase with thrombospondin motifs gon-1-like [Crassostrea virginica]